MKSHQESASPLARWVKPVLIGMVAGAVVCALLLMVFAAVLAAQDIPHMAVTPLAVAAGVIGALAGGFVGARVAGSRGLLVGLAVGALLYLLIMIAGFILLQDVGGVYAIVKLLLLIVGGAVGGLLGVSRRRRR